MRRLGYIALLVCLALAACGGPTEPNLDCWQKAARNIGTARVDTLGWVVRNDSTRAPILACLTGAVTITLVP